MSIPIATKTEIPQPGLKLFAYGTLMPGQIAWERFCAQRVTGSMPSRVRGLLYHLPSRGFPAAVESHDPKDWINGFLLYFDDSHALPLLDRYEDCSPENQPEKGLYYRKLVPCFDPTGEPFDSAWCYFMTARQVAAESGIICPKLWRPRQ